MKGVRSIVLSKDAMFEIINSGFKRSFLSSGPVKVDHVREITDEGVPVAYEVTFDSKGSAPEPESRDFPGTTRTKKRPPLYDDEDEV